MTVIVSIVYRDFQTIDVMEITLKNHPIVQIYVVVTLV